MPELILHHYPTSPFSEKIRLIFGLKKLKWRSVIIPAIMPKPDVVALTGGYRRTPVLQIGADVFCDTAIIADALEAVQPEPTLYHEDPGSSPGQAAGQARILAQWADTTLFWTVIPYVFQPAGLPTLFNNAPPEHIQAFVNDRKSFRANLPRMTLPEATGALGVYLRRLDRMLEDGRPYLLGALPTIADLSTYHCVWFIHRGGPLVKILEPHRHLANWFEHVKRIGHGESSDLSSADAIGIAAKGEHADHGARPFLDTHGIALGERVRIAATDYGIDPVEGELVVCAANELALRRTDPRAGTVVVHFPRIGFQLQRAE